MNVNNSRPGFYQEYMESQSGVTNTGQRALAACLKVVLHRWEPSSMPVCIRETKFKVSMAHESQLCKGGGAEEFSRYLSDWSRG